MATLRIRKTSDDNALGRCMGILFLTVVWIVSVATGLISSQFGVLYDIAYVVLYASNWMTNGFGTGILFRQWRETREFRKSMDQELA